MAGPTLKYTITGDADPAVKEMRRFSGEVEKQSSGIKESFSKIGALAAGLGAATFLKGAITQASDLNETMNKASVIFGKNADAVKAWAADSEQALGLSHQAALDSAASFGDMFSQLGFAGDQAAQMSEQVVQLAADLGSFSNLGTDDVLERLAGGFRGEYDSLQKLIPNISAARVQTEALAETHKSTAAELTAQEKAQATLNIVMQDGARAQGDFARTSGGFANQQKILTAQFQDLQAEIGTELLPILVKLAGVLSDVLGFIREHRTSIEVLAVAVGGLWAAYKGYTILKSVVTWLGTARVRYAQYVAELSYGNRVQQAQSAALRSGTLAAAGTAAAIVGVGFAISQAVDGGLGPLHKLDEALADAAQTTQAWRDELLDSNGVLTDNIRLELAKQLQDGGVADEASKAGISLRDLTTAVVDGQPALQKLLGTWREHAQITGDSLLKLEELTSAYGDAVDQSIQLTNFTKGETTSLVAAAGAAGRVAGAVDRVAIATGAATGNQKQLADEMNNTRMKAAGLDDAIKALTDSWDRLNGRAINTKRAQIAFQEDLDNLTKAFKGQNDTLDIATAKGREHYNAILDLAEGAKEDAQAVLEQTKSHKAAREAFKADRDSARDLLKELGLAPPVIRKIINNLFAIPKFVQTKYELRTKEAEAALRRLDGMISALGVHAGSAININTGAATGPGFASGTRGAPPGWAWVGERGPELLKFRGGEQVLPHGQSMQVSRGFANGTGANVTIEKFEEHIHYPEPLTVRESQPVTMRRLAQKLGELL